MAKTPAPLFIDIARNTYRSHTESHISTNPDLADMYLGNEPPTLPDDFKKDLTDAADAYEPNDWEQFADVSLVVGYFDGLYRGVYNRWTWGRLESGATDAVVQWQEAAQKASVRQ